MDELRQKYQKVSDTEAAKFLWQDVYDSSRERCMHGPGCKQGPECNVRSVPCA